MIGVDESRYAKAETGRLRKRNENKTFVLRRFLKDLMKIFL
jgi:hypothetical protein